MKMNNKYPLTFTSDRQLNDQYFIVFSIKDKKYAINIKNVVEVINIPAIDIPESTPEAVIGMFNYNGNIIKAIDLCPFLGFITSEFSINNKMIILSLNGENFAVHTENIETIKRFHKEKIQQMPFSGENSILSHIYKDKNFTINVINSEVLYSLISKEGIKRSEIDYLTLLPSDEKSKQILDLRAKHHTVTQDTFSFPIDLQSTKQYILFTIDENNYYMDIKYVKEFISMKRLNITKLPYTKDYIAGIVSVKGEFLVVINLKRFIDKSNTNEVKGGKLIIVECKNFNIGFLVDDIKYIKSSKDIQKLKMYASSQEYIYAEFMEEGKLYSILDFDKIINDERIYINIE